MSAHFDEFQEFMPLSETEREVCEAAVNHYFEEDYQTSAEILQNIVANRPHDIRFKHNLTVAEFRQAACVGWKQFNDDLLKAFSDAKLTPDPEKIKQDNIQSPVLWFNLAIVYFHQKKYKAALKIVNSLSKTFCNFMTQLTKRTKLLLIDVLIKLQQYERALNEIEVFDAQLRPASVDISSAENLDLQVVVTIPADTKFDNEVKTKLQQYKTLCHLCMKSLKFAKKECRQLLSAGVSPLISYTGIFMKAYHEYLRGNVKKAHKILINLRQPIDVSNSENPEQILTQAGDHFSVMALNNEACCDFYSGKPTIAGMNLQKASVEFTNFTNKDQAHLFFAKTTNVQLELMYNFGVTLLNLKRPTEAFTFLNMCLNFYYNNPRLWLRVAECCIQIHKPGNDHHLDLSSARRNLVKQAKGTDNCKKLVFVEPVKLYKPVKAEQNVKTNDKEKPTLEYANTCLENALHLVESDSIANDGCLYVKPSTPISNIQEINSLHAAILCAAAYVQLTLENYPVAIKRCHQLMSLQNIPGAYQYLAKMYLGEAYFKYGQMTKSLDYLFHESVCDITVFLSQPDSDDKKDDGGSESNWPGQPNTGSGNGVIKPITDWYPSDSSVAHSILVYNQAVALASSGDLDRASELLRAWISKNEGRPLAPEFMKLAVYLHIRLGNIAKAKHLLKNSANKT